MYLFGKSDEKKQSLSKFKTIVVMTQPIPLVARMEAVWKKRNLKQKQAFFFEFPFYKGLQQIVGLKKRNSVSHPVQHII